MRLSLSKVLTSGLFIGIILLVGIIIFSSYYSSKKAMLHHASTIMNTISDFALDKSQNYMKIAKDAANLTQQLEAKDVVSSENQSLMIKYFYEQLQINKQFSSIYYANKNGDFIMLLRLKDGYLFKHTFKQNNERISKKVTYDTKLENILSTVTQKDTFDPRERTWFKRAVDEKKLIWTNPYVFFTLQTLGITTASPIYNDQNIIDGVVGVDIEIKELSNFITNLKISENSKVFMMDQNTNMIAFPKLSTIQYNKDQQSYTLNSIHTIGDPIALKSYQKTMEKTSTKNIDKKIFSSFSIDDTNYLSLFLPMQSNGINWIIGMYLPEDDYLGDIKTNQQINIGMTLIIGLIFLLISYFIARSIISPINKLRKMAHSLKELDLNIPPLQPTMYIELNETIEASNKMKESLKKAYTDTLFRLALASEFKDLDTASHIKRIGLYSVEIARELGLQKDQLYILKHASAMHDIGKLGIDDSILLKKAKLNASERKEVEKHSELGAMLLKNPTSEIMEEARKIALYHHEKWDGNGYPRGLKEQEIPLYARIVAVADVFDALVSKRCYKEAYSEKKAKALILEGKGTHFDPQCIEAFEKTFDKLVEIHNNFHD